MSHNIQNSAINFVFPKCKDSPDSSTEINSRLILKSIEDSSPQNITSDEKVNLAKITHGGFRA